MQRRPRCPVPLIAALVLLSPSTAVAQEPGVTFDDGPSSKEYAIPLDAARGQTKTKAPKPKPVVPAAAKPTPPPASAPDGGASGDPEPKRKRSTTKKKANNETKRTQDAAPIAAPRDPPSAKQARITEATSSSADGMGAGVVVGGLAVAALALGALAGLVLRRRRSAVTEV